MNKKYLLFVGIVIALFGWQQSSAARWYVDVNATGAANGASWKDAFTGLQDGLDNAVSGDTIWVASGTYYPVKPPVVSVDPRDRTFLMKNGVHIYGGFVGSEVNLADRKTDSTNLHVKYETILSGDIGNVNDQSDNVYHVVISNNLSSFTLDGFTVKAGFASEMTFLTVGGNDIYRNGGAGIYNFETQGIYRNIVVRDNLAFSTDAELGGGAGMYNWEINNQGTLLVDGSVFFGNTAKSCNGGAMYNSNSSVTITNTYFTKNIANTDDEGGGAIDNREGSDCVIENVVFDANESTNSGGGIYNDGSSCNLTNVLFVNNIASGSCGGGMDTDGGSNAILNNVTFKNNYAEEDGGGLYGWKSSPTLNNVYFYNNTANGNGGGMYYYNTCKPVITNAIFMYNTSNAYFGGFGLERESEAVVTNVLFARNYAVNDGGGLGALGSNTAMILTNVTVANNYTKNGTGGGGYDQGSTSKIRNTIFAGNYPDEVNIAAALAMLVKHSIVGDTYLEDGSVNPYGTVVASTAYFEDTLNNDFRMVSGSVALDLGDSTFYAPAATPNLSTVKIDLNGLERTLGNNTDIGTYEKCPQIIIPSGTVSVSPGELVPNGTTMIFTLTPKNAGSNPTFQWFKNSTPIAGKTSATFSGAAGTDFGDNDTIWAMIYTHESCISPANTASAKKIVKICPQLLLPSVVVTLSTGTLVPSGTAVKFSLNLTNVGGSPVIEWFKNGKKIPFASGVSYTATAGINFNDADTFTAKVVSSDPCAVPNNALSNSLVMHICANVVTPSASLSVDKGTLVPNATQVRFTLTLTDAGVNPTIEWYKNNIQIIGQTGVTYDAVSGLDFNDKDTISVKITSLDPCAVPNNAVSNNIVMNICPNTVIPSLTISSDKSMPVPPGTAVTFTASTADAGVNPDFEWYLNGAIIPLVTDNYYTATSGVDFKTGDSIWAKVISHEPCAVPDFGFSNKLIIDICTNVLEPTVDISVSPQTVVPVGATVTFSLAITDAGANPDIEWYKNNTRINTQSGKMSYVAVAGVDFSEGDSIWAKITSHDPCAVPNNASTHKIVIEFCTQTILPTATLSKDVESGVFAGTDINFVLTVKDAGATPAIEWYKNSTLIPTATGLNYTAKAGTDFDNGDTIWALAIASDPCAVPSEAISNKFVMNVFGLSVNKIASNFDMHLSPNPNKGSFVLNANFVAGEDYVLNVVDVIGRNVFSEKFQINTSNKEITLPASLTPGVYLLTIYNPQQGRSTLRFVIE